MKAYLFDIECYKNFFCCGFKEVKTGEKKVFALYDIQGQKVNNLSGLSSFVRNNILIGFHNKEYDNQLVNFLLTHWHVLSILPIKLINKQLFKESTEIIQKDSIKHKYNLPFRSCDLMAIGTIKSSLKHIGVSLKHELLQSLPIPWDQEIKTLEQVEILYKYNWNDIEITEKLYHKLRKAVLSRLEIESAEGFHALDITKSGISNLLTIKMYSEVTGLDKSSFINLRTKRNVINLKDCISPIIKYKTKELQDLLKSIKSKSVNGDGSDDFSQFFRFGNTFYKIAKGGIHDHMKNTIRIAKDDYIIRDADVGSYYPRIIEKFDVFPEHFDHRVKAKYAEYTDLRLKIKKTEPVKAEILKIVLNSFFGKYGSDTFFLYDPKALYSVTLNGQLSLIMLIESLELAGIEVFSANTDGITCYFHKSKEEDYKRICKEWEEYTKLELEFADYDRIYMMNCNNYFVLKEEKLYKTKGFFSTEFDPMKGFDSPIITEAVIKYFKDKIPVRQTIESHSDILDFTSCQNKDKTYYYKYRRVVEGEVVEEIHNYDIRYYASKGGGLLIKSNGDKDISMIANQNVTIINDVNNPYPQANPIDYDYYVKKAIDVINDLIKGKERYSDAVKKWLKDKSKLHPSNQLTLL